MSKEQKPENIVNQLERDCVAAGTNLNKVCKTLNIRRDMLSRWKEEEPKTIRTLRAIKAEIKKQKALKDQEQTAE